MKLKTVITNNDFESNEVAKDLVNYLATSFDSKSLFVIMIMSQMK